MPARAHQLPIISGDGAEALERAPLTGEEYTPAIPNLDALVEAGPFVREYLARMGGGG